MSSRKDLVRLPVRLSAKEHRLLCQMSQSSGRSLNDEIIHVLLRRANELFGSEETPSKISSPKNIKDSLPFDYEKVKKHLAKCGLDLHQDVRVTYYVGGKGGIIDLCVSFSVDDQPPQPGPQSGFLGER